MAGRLVPRAWVWRTLLVYLASRLVPFLVIYAQNRPLDTWLPDLVNTWDGRHYYGIAAHGYPSSTSLAPPPERLAFYPLFPLVVRTAGWVSGHALSAAVVTAITLGFVATCMVWLFTRRIVLDQTMRSREGAGPAATAQAEAAADRAAALFCYFPAAFVLTLVYAEGLMVALAAASLVALMRRRWLLGGIAAALATATRPNALALMPACAWVAAEAVWRRREWRALLAPLLAPIGMVAYLAYLQLHVGDWRAWHYIEDRLWHQSLDFSAQFLRGGLAHTLIHLESRNWTFLTILVGLGFVGAGFVAMVLWRPPAMVVAYTLGVLFLCFASSHVGFRPRLVMAAFPLLAALAVRLRPWAYHALLGLSAVLFFLFMQVSFMGKFTP